MYTCCSHTRFFRQREKPSEEKLDSPTENCILRFGQPPQQIFTCGEIKLFKISEKNTSLTHQHAYDGIRTIAHPQQIVLPSCIKGVLGAEEVNMKSFVQYWINTTGGWFSWEDKAHLPISRWRRSPPQRRILCHIGREEDNPTRLLAEWKV